MFWTKSWKQYPTKQQMFYLISNNIQFMLGTAGLDENELLSDIVPWIHMHGHASVGRQANTYIHQLSADTWICLEDLPSEMADIYSLSSYG